MQSSINQYEYIQDLRYDRYGKRTYVLYGNNTEESFSYQPQLQRMNTTQVTSVGGTDLIDMTYQYDLVGNITSTTNNGVPSVNNFIGGNSTNTYSYDNRNRLIEGEGLWAGDDINLAGTGDDYEANYETDMSYDAMGRILTKQQAHWGNTGNAVAANTYNRAYAYTGYNGGNVLDQITSANETIDFTYDDNGNAASIISTSAASKALYWDDNNMMRAITVDDSYIQHNIYDASGVRTAKSSGEITQVFAQGALVSSTASLRPYKTYPSGTITTSEGGRYTKHYYAGTSRVASRLLGQASIFEQNPLSGPGSDNVPVRQQSDLDQIQDEAALDDITFVPAPVIIDNCTNYPLGSEAYKQCDCEQNGNCDDLLYYFHGDHLGSTSLLTDGAGMAYQHMVYLPFGELMAEQSVADFSTPYKFNGKELDSETGMYDFEARYYDPSIGIWMSVDPLADAPANIGTSPYTYVWNNPLNFIDPDGRHGVSHHEDEDGNIIASYDDGDNNVYMHENGTTKSDLDANYYYSGFSETDRGGSQMAGMEVSVTARRKRQIKQEGIRSNFIIGVGLTAGRGKIYDEFGNVENYMDWGFGFGFEVGFGAETIMHTTTPYLSKSTERFDVYSMDGGADVSHNYSLGIFGGGHGGNSARDFIYFEDSGSAYTTRSGGLAGSANFFKIKKIGIGYSRKGTKTTVY